jgi:asparagine synthase (glutamine-hydrolysing)
MCGFAGILLESAGQRSVAIESALGRMGSVIAHRGPDDSGTEWCGPCGMAHRRLSIIDLSAAGHQPMSNEDGSVWISYNGEVYNFLELRRRFSLDTGHVFRSRTDTEVLIHLYEELGSAFLEHLNGMFAIAIWDARKNTLLLARDPFGIKPLFCMEHGGAFWFASEIKSLLQAPGLKREPSAEALFQYLAFDYVPGTLTPFSGITELPPGYSMEHRPGTGKGILRRFFSLDYRPDPAMDGETALRESARILRESVSRQLVSDVPVGVMLSGGMDSSALTALMAEARGDAGFHTFSLTFSERSFDESPFARMVSDSLGTEHHEIAVTPEKAAALLPGYLAHIDEPYADGSAIPTWLLAAEAEAFVTVLLSGEGGDELFAGYDTHAALKARRLYRSLIPGFLRRGVVSPLVHLLPVSHRKLSFEFKAKRFTEGAELGVPESHFFWRAVLIGADRDRVLGQAFRDLSFPPPESFFREIYDSCSAETDLQRILCIDSSCHLPHDLMIKNDRMTMAHSLEARVPFTDAELFRFLATVPDGLKLPGLRKKHLLRTAMRGVLPPKVLSKKKVGLEMPYSTWFRGPLKELAGDMLRGSAVLSSALLDPAGISMLWDEHQRMQRDNGRALWGLLNYAMWYDMYIASDGYLSHIRPARAAV